jgi:hypothetical protein
LPACATPPPFPPPPTYTLCLFCPRPAPCVLRAADCLRLCYTPPSVQPHPPPSFSPRTPHGIPPFPPRVTVCSCPGGRPCALPRWHLPGHSGCGVRYRVPPVPPRVLLRHLLRGARAVPQWPLLPPGVGQRHCVPWRFLLWALGPQRHPVPCLVLLPLLCQRAVYLPCRCGSWPPSPPLHHHARASG